MVIPRSRSAFSLSSTQAVKIGDHQNIDHRAQFNRVLTILKRTLSKFSSFLLKLFDGTLIDTTTLVDQMTSRGRLARIDVTDDCD